LRGTPDQFDEFVVLDHDDVDRQLRLELDLVQRLVIGRVRYANRQADYPFARAITRSEATSFLSIVSFGS